MTVTTPTKTFHLILIKPSHYDDEGYVIQWVRSSIPSNSMAAIYGLALDCVEKNVLGEDVQIQITAFDETNTCINTTEVIQQIQESGGHGLVALTGVQTNQFPRAMDLARPFLAQGIQVCIGGFHVSGCIAMLKDIPAEIQEAMDQGISLYAGELEGRLEPLLLDAYEKRLKPLYDFMQDLPHLEGQPVPYLPADLVHRMSGSRTSFDAGRGCPFLCSFCTIINVQGRKSRFRTPDDVEHIVRSNLAQGIHKFTITDDNFARNKAWESLFDRLIHLRTKEGLVFKITIQVDTMCHRIPRFIEKAGQAGVDRVFIGLENINPESLEGARKNQNNITEYRSMLQAWHKTGALILAGFIMGFPTDTPESIARDIRIIQRELPVDLLYFFILTPLPGSQDHKELYESGVPLEQDMNAYDSVHVTAPHQRMSDKDLLEAYRKAWDIYYTPDHVERVMRRGQEWKFDVNKIKWMMFSFYGTAKVEGVHPLDGGLIRRKIRCNRRGNFPIENPIVFYSRYLWESVQKLTGFLQIYLSYQLRYRRVLKGPVQPLASDIAMQPVRLEELDHLELFTVAPSAKIVVEKAKEKAAKKRPTLKMVNDPGVPLSG